MDTVKQFGRLTFSSLAIPNYRSYFVGQAFSQCGMWMQTVVIGWLVIITTGSGTHLGSVVALQYLPMLLFGPLGGVFVDRLDKKYIISLTYTAFGAISLIMGLAVFTGTATLWMIYCYALLQGAIRIFDMPARQTFVSELVDSANLKNAVSLNATAGNLARAVGPSIGGVLIATVGIAWCFLFTTLSYAAAFLMLRNIKREELFPSEKSGKEKGQLIEGFRYVLSDPLIRNILLMVAVIGTFSYEFQVTLPLLANKTFHGDARSYALLLASMGIGSVVGGLFAAGRQNVGMKNLILIAIVFGASMVATSLMPTLILSVACMLLVGFFSINLTSLANTMLQLESAPSMRGRVMSLWGVAFIGSTTIGGPIVGFIGEYAGPRYGLLFGGLVAIFYALYMRLQHSSKS